MTATNGTHAAAAATNGHTHHEAPASATARMTSPGGVDWLLTIRDDTANGLMTKVTALEAHLLGNGWTPDGGRASNGRSTGSQQEANGNESGAVRMCPDGHGQMKASKHKPGEYYCPAVVGTHPQTGKKLYCTHKA